MLCDRQRSTHQHATRCRKSHIAALLGASSHADCTACIDGIGGWRQGSDLWESRGDPEGHYVAVVDPSGGPVDSGSTLTGTSFE